MTTVHLSGSVDDMLEIGQHKVTYAVKLAKDM